MRYASQSGLQILIGQVSWEPDPKSKQATKSLDPQISASPVAAGLFWSFQKRPHLVLEAAFAPVRERPDTENWNTSGN